MSHMNISSFFNPQEALEQGQTILKKQAQITAQTAQAQLTGQSGTAKSPADTATPSGTGAPDKFTQDFLHDMYAQSDTQPQLQGGQSSANPLVAQLQGNTTNNSDQARMAETRKKLEELKKQHMETYYKPTFEERAKEEERPAEKVEREEEEEKQKRWELKQEEQKKNEVPMAVQMAAKKAEMFRGAAG